MTPLSTSSYPFSIMSDHPPPPANPKRNPNPPSISSITSLALGELHHRLAYSPESFSDKQLTELAFGLLDRGGGNGHGGHKKPSELGEATRGAVLGALQGLASIAKRDIDIEQVGERLVNPHLQEEHEEENKLAAKLID